MPGFHASVCTTSGTPHATLLLKAGENTKVVTERLGHSTTAYTQDAYQHVLPGMQRDAARRFRERLLSGGPEDGSAEELGTSEADERDETGGKSNLLGRPPTSRWVGQ